MNIKVSIETATDFCIEAFTKCGVPLEDAKITAQNLIDGELRGLSSHGLSRMIYYVPKLIEGGFKIDPDIKIISEAPSSALIDGDFGLGAVVGTKAMNLCIEKAKSSGCACVSVKKGNHFGIASFYSMMALDEDMIGFSCCTSVAKMAVWGGIDPVLGTNPLSVAIPAKRYRPIVFDAATSKVALGKIMVANIEGKDIPNDWAINKNGENTTNPQEAMSGAVLPFGDYKGSGIAIIIDILSTVLSGAMFGMHSKELRGDYKEGQDVGFFFGAIKISNFQKVDVFKDRIDEMIDEMKASRKIENNDYIYMPGELEFIKTEENVKKGITVGEGVLNGLKRIKDQLNMENDPMKW